MALDIERLCRFRGQAVVQGAIINARFAFPTVLLNAYLLLHFDFDSG
jgi:hypothetical protein